MHEKNSCPQATSKKHILRLPFRDYKLAGPEMLQSVLMIAVGFSTVPILEESLGMTYSEALTVAAIAEILGLLHVTFSDPVVPGWIASALSLVLVYLGGFSTGMESVQALIALQILLGVMFVVLGATGLAQKLMKIIPGSLKAGILLGAGITAIGRVFTDYLPDYPISIISGILVTLIVLYSNRFKIMKSRSRIFAQVAKYGMLPGLVVAMVVGFISGEVPLPTVQWGFIPFDYISVFKNYSVFSIGLPSARVFLQALPMAASVYIIAFGEIVTSQSILKEAQDARPDEEIPINANRTNVLAGVRNLILGLFAPFTALAGPLWSAVTVSTCERYKEGPKSMKSIFSGMGSFKLVGAFCILLMPAATLLEPILPLAMAITMMVQGFACSYIAIEQVKEDRIAAGVAGTTGAVVYLVGINTGLVVGILGFILLESKPRKAKIEETSLDIPEESYPIDEKKGMSLMTRNPNVIFTIDQETDARGWEIAQILSDHLGVPCYGEEILTEAARQSRIPEELFRRYDERPVIAAYNLRAENEGQIQLPPPSDFVTAQVLACRALADRGPCILVDRHASLALENRENVTKIFLRAQEKDRARTLAAERDLLPDDAIRTLRKIDRIRSRYYRSYASRWGRDERYDLVLDVTGLDAETAADQILSALDLAGDMTFAG